jgi:hypothetical protein
MAQQSVSVEIPQVPDAPPNNNPTPPDAPQAAMIIEDGHPVSPAVARARTGAPAAQGHGHEGQGNN